MSHPDLPSRDPLQRPIRDIVTDLSLLDPLTSADDCFQAVVFLEELITSATDLQDALKADLVGKQG